MPTLLLLLLVVLACPLIMIFMMRGMNRGHDSGHGAADDRPPNESHRTVDLTASAADHAPQARIAALEREVAELRRSSRPVQLNKPASKR